MVVYMPLVIFALLVYLGSSSDQPTIYFRVAENYDEHFKDVTFTPVHNTWMAPAVYMKASRLPTFRQHVKSFIKTAEISDPAKIERYLDAADEYNDEMTALRDVLINFLFSENKEWPTKDFVERFIRRRYGATHKCFQKTESFEFFGSAKFFFIVDIELDCCSQGDVFEGPTTIMNIREFANSSKKQIFKAVYDKAREFGKI